MLLSSMLTSSQRHPVSCLVYRLLLLNSQIQLTDHMNTWSTIRMSVCDLLYLGIFCFPLEISVLFSSRFSLYFVAVLIKRFPANTLHYELKVCQDNLLSCLLMGDLPACHFPSAMQSAPRRDWLVSIFSFLFSCEQVSGLQQNDQTWDLGALLAAM